MTNSKKVKRKVQRGQHTNKNGTHQQKASKQLPGRGRGRRGGCHGYWVQWPVASNVIRPPWMPYLIRAYSITTKYLKVWTRVL